MGTTAGPADNGDPATGTPAEAAVPDPGDDGPPGEGDRRPGPPPGPPRPSPRRLRWIRGGLLTAAGLTGCFLMMANDGQLPRGPLLGLGAMLVAIGGFLDLLGLWAAPTTGGRPLARSWLVRADGEPWLLSPAIGLAAATLAVLLGASVGGFAVLPWTLAVAMALLLPSGTRNPGLLLFALGGLLYLPFLGVSGLWDPWETHYGEVAREILARDDWISTWWAREPGATNGWFFSKPILIFWAEAWSMGAFGVDFHADANPAHPEWAVRFPHYVLATGAVLTLYVWVARAFGRRAGLWAGLVLLTTPFFFFLTHQAITDMPFVACMTIAMAFLGLALHAEPDEEAATYVAGRLGLGLRPMVLGALLLAIVPQILYLVTRHVDLVEGFRFAWHADVIMQGSAGNHGVPGNPPVEWVRPHIDAPWGQPMAQAALWLAGLVGLVWVAARETRVRSLYLFLFYLFCGLGFLAKGIPGFALPGLVSLLFLVGSRRWDLLVTGQLRVATGALIVILAGMPWYVAMTFRHSREFLQRLLIHDHINRLTAGVHGDNSSIEYFIEQLGYGLFPWIGLAPLALALWLERPRGVGREEERRRHAALLLSLWLAAAFTLFSAMTTKFHHYIFPAVPPAMALVGIVAAYLTGPVPRLPRWRTVLAATLACLAPVPALLGVAGRWGDVRGLIPPEVVEARVEDWVLRSEQVWPASVTWPLIALGLGLFALAWWLGRDPERPREAGWRPASVTAGLCCAAVLVAFTGRDLSWVTDARPQGFERPIHLFIYNYTRSWPPAYDYRPLLTAVAIVATVLLLLALARTLRRTALLSLLGVSLAFTAWCLDVYMPDISPHWSQRNVIKRYYELRSSPEEPVVAYQLNWKGENFYTGNRVHVFVDLDTTELREWARENRGRTAYFLTEESRLGGLKSAIGVSDVERLTTRWENNKFMLIRVVVGERDL